MDRMSKAETVTCRPVLNADRIASTSRLRKKNGDLTLPPSHQHPPSHAEFVSPSPSENNTPFYFSPCICYHHRITHFLHRFVVAICPTLSRPGTTTITLAHAADAVRMGPTTTMPSSFGGGGTIIDGRPRRMEKRRLFPTPDFFLPFCLVEILPPTEPNPLDDCLKRI